MESEWLLIDNLSPNRPCLVNLSNADCINWDKGTMCVEFRDGRCIEVECEKSVFVGVASKLKIIDEVE